MTSRTATRATDFARELRVVDGKHKVVNGLALFPTRVVALGDRTSASMFTMFQRELAR